MPRPLGRGRRFLEFLLLTAGAHLGLHLLQLTVDLLLRCELRELSIERGGGGAELLEVAGGHELVDCGCASLHLLGLVLRALDREAGVVHLAPDSGRGFTDPHLRLGRGVLRLDHFLLRAELLDPGGQLLLARDELVSSGDLQELGSDKTQLDRELEQLASQTQVDHELEQLKAEVGAGSGAEKKELES